MVFFFQAEDGIRYLVRSRGLGDVYKRQVFINGAIAVVVDAIADFERTGVNVGIGVVTVGIVVGIPFRYGVLARRDREGRAAKLVAIPVSYTHLTLPTSDLV